MLSKIVLFILGLAVGAGICAAVLTKKAKTDTATAVAENSSTFSGQIKDLEVTLASTKGRLEEAQSSNDKLTARVQELMKNETATAATKPDPAQAGGLAGLATLFGGGDGTNALFGALAEGMKMEMEDEVNNKLATLKTNLNLTLDQETRLREILTKQATKGMELAEKLFKGELSMEAINAAAHEFEGNETAEIATVLTPEQLKAYEAHQAAEKENAARRQAESDLEELQSSLKLTPEQREKVSAILLEQAKLENPEAMPADFRKHFEQKREALRTALTPEQMDRYTRQQEMQLKLMEAFLPKDGGKANVKVKISK